VSYQEVNIGASADDGTGDPLRTAFGKLNDNLAELYTFLGDGTDLTEAGARASLGLATDDSPTFAGLTNSALTSGRIPYSSTGGLQVDSANLTFDGTTLSTTRLSLDAGTITTDVRPLTSTVTWNNAAVAFTANKNSVVNTASAAGALLESWSAGAAGATLMASIGKTGIIASYLNGAGAFLVNVGNPVGFGRNGSTGNMNMYGGTNTPSDSNGHAALSGTALTLATGLQFNWSSSSNAGNPTIVTGLSSPASAVVRVTNGSTGGGALEFLEQTAPAGSANTFRIFAQDNGAGKTQAMIIFGSGAAQQLAIEA
jgi:hypothetical protein